MAKDAAEARYPRAAALFFVQVAFYSALIYWAQIRWLDGASFGGLKWSGTATDLARIWSVGIAGLVAEIATKGSLKDLGLSTLGVGFFLLAAGIPLLYCAAIYVPCWLLQIAVFKGAPTLLHGVAASLLHAPWRIVTALGEEIGWRGSATPNLAKATSARTAGLVCGVAWAAWHVGDILFFGYNVGTPAVYAIACFTCLVVGASLFLAWLRLASGSVWPPTLFHAAHNAFVYDLFQRTTVENPQSALFVSEFGLGMAAAGVALGVFGWRRLRRSSPPAG